MPINPGQVLNNRYRIVRLLGQGGFGAVYRAWDLQLEGVCALKENLDPTTEAQRQFEREAKLLFGLRHSGLPKVFDYFALPGQGQYLVMEYIEGEDLELKLKQAASGATSIQPLPEAQVLPWIAQVCDALSYLHSRTPPVIHRDVKPANIKITPEGQAVLVDFGIAKSYNPQQITTIGAKAVTPGYSPLEQYSGNTDAQSDVYALGTTAYTLLTGQAPPPSVDISAGIAPPPPPAHSLNPAVSAQTSKAVAHAMRLNRNERTPSAAAFKAELSLVGSAPAPAIGVPPGRTVTAPVVQPGASTSGGAGRLPAWLRWTGGALLVVALVTVAYLVGGGSGKDSRGEVASSPTMTPMPTMSPRTLVLTLTYAPNNTPALTLALTPTRPPHAPLPTMSPGVQMALVPAGEFQMGSESGSSDEQPVQTIFLEDFYIDLYEVTNALFAEFLNKMGNGQEEGVAWLDASEEGARIHQVGGIWQADGGYSDHPAIEVNWYGARAYCAWRGARLPTEAEWEKAARGGLVSLSYPWGDESPVCTVGDDTGAQFASCGGGTVEVGSFAPNGYGLFDMAGNVWEWVNSLYNSYPYRADDGREDSQTSGTRVLRGGSWNNNPFNLRTAYRSYYEPVNADNDVGFRCARSPGN